jgi:hypothetical protein
MTSREHARRLMLILLSSPGGPDGDAASKDRSGERSDDRQAREGRDDSTEGDERTTEELFEALILA